MQHSQKLKKGLWSPDEDEKLYNYITRFGISCWSDVPRQTGLQRCGKSCRLRWMNYLRPGIKRGKFTEQEESMIISLHKELGNRWSLIATKLRGRTDNEVKNFWNSCVKKKLRRRGIDPTTHKPLRETQALEGHQREEKTGKHVPSQAIFNSFPPFLVEAATKENYFRHWCQQKTESEDHHITDSTILSNDNMNPSSLYLTEEDQFCDNLGEVVLLADSSSYCNTYGNSSKEDSSNWSLNYYKNTLLLEDEVQNWTTTERDISRSMVQHQIATREENLSSDSGDECAALLTSVKVNLSNACLDASQNQLLFEYLVEDLSFFDDSTSPN